MEITKKRLKEIIKEEMEFLAEDGNVRAITSSEKKLFEIILKKLDSSQLETFGIKRI